MRATTSLPVPLSPRISTVAVVSATCSMVFFTSSMRGLVPNSSEIVVAPNLVAQLGTSRKLRCFSSILSMRKSRSAVSKGLGTEVVGAHLDA